MNLITIEQARAQCKTDGDDDELLELFATAAEKACAKIANRNLYPTQGELDAAIAAIPAAMAAAFSTHDADVALANAMTNVAEGKAALERADEAMWRVRHEQDRVLCGMVAEEDIIMAVLLTLGHFYRNRETVVTGQGAAAVELPMGAQAIMEGYWRIPVL